jgi:tetratricopeptide (TPR) repeat protein
LGNVTNFYKYTPNGVQLFTAAIALNPANSNYYLHRGEAKAAAGDIVGAMADYNAGLAKEPKNTAILLKRGLLKAAKDDYPGALADFNTSIKIDSTSDAAALPYQNRGYIETKQGDYKAAMKDLDKAVSIFSNEETFLFRGDLKLILKDYRRRGRRLP